MIVETRHLVASEPRRINAGGPGSAAPGSGGWRFLPSVAGGSFELPDHHQAGAAGGDRLLLWQLTTHTTSRLQLVEVSATHGQIGAAVELELDGHVFAGAALAAPSSGGGGGGDCALYLLFSDKSAAQLRLLRPAGGAGVAATSAASGVAPAAGSVLDGLHAGSLQLLPLAPQLAAIGAPSALAAVNGHLVVAGASDAVAAVPLGAFDGADPSRASTFTTSTSLLQRLVGSLYQPVARTGVVAAFAAARAGGARGGGGGRPLLALVDDGASLRLWAPPPAAAPLASYELLPGAAVRSLAPRAAFAAGGAPEGELLVVSQLEPADAPGATTLAACHVRLGAGDAAGGGGAGDAGDATAGGFEVVARFALQLPTVGARLLGAQLRDAELLVLAALPGADTRLLVFGARDGAYLSGARLLSRGPSADGWGAKEDLWAAALPTLGGAGSAWSGGPSPAEESVLGQLLVPGQLCRAALREALLYWGAAVAREQVEAASFAQLRAYLRAALLSVAARHPAWGEARCWHALFARYCECWRRLHAPLALASAAGGAWLGVVRGGPALTALRDGTQLEDEAEDGGDGGRGSAVASPVRAAVRSCLAAVGGALGAPVLRLVMRLAAAGADLEGALLPGALDLLLYGPQQQQQQQQDAAASASDGSGAARDDAARQRLAEWRAGRQAALLSIQQALDALPDPVRAISDFAEDALLSTADASAGFAMPSTGGPPPSLPAPLGAVLCSSVLQAARARCLLAQRLLLLLGVVERMGRAGSAPLAPEQLAEVRESLRPRLVAALRCSSMALLLVKTPAASPAGGSQPGAAAALPQHLEALQLGGGGGGGGGAAGVPHTPSAGAAPATAMQRAARGPQHNPPALAAHLLRAFCEARPAAAAAALAGRVGPAAGALLDFLCAGAPPATGGAVAAAAPSDGVEARALRVGWRLLCAREFAGVAALVRLCGGSPPADVGLAFLLGVSLACTLRAGGGAGAGGSGDAARRELLDAASGHLFRAAAGLASAEAAPLRAVLQQLRSRQQRGGAGAAAGAVGLDLAPPPSGGAVGLERDEPAAGSAAAAPPGAAPRLRLEFFEAVARLFEAEGALEGALEFARAALGAVDGAFPAGDGADPATRHERLGALWLAVFTYASRLGRYADAYAAAAANPVPAHRLECVRRLVHRLAEERRLDVLCGLPFAGAVAPEPTQADPCPAPLPLVRVAADVLARRAQHSSLAGGAAARAGAPRGAAHLALFDFLVAWGDHKGAAAAMLGLAWRLRAEAAQTDDAVAEVEDAYAASLNQLELLDTGDAWLDAAHPLLSDCAPGGGAAAAMEAASGGEGLTPADGGLDRGDYEGAGPGGGGGDGLLFGGGGGRGRQQQHHHGSGGIVTLAALRREAALFSASAALAPVLPGLQVLRPESAPTADAAYDGTLALGRLAEAEALAHALWRGGALEERLERLAAAAAARCARAESAGDDVGADAAAAAAADGGVGALAALPGDGAAAALLEAGGRPGYLGSAAAGAWQWLRALLARYDGAGRRRLAGRLRVAAVDAALAEAPGAALPAWLLAPFAPAAAGGAGAGLMAGGPDDPAALLRAYLRHGRLEDAAALALDHLAAWQAADPLARCRPASGWVPLRALEVLDACLADAQQQQQQQMDQQQQQDQQQERHGGGGGGAAQRLAGLKLRLRAAVAEHLALGARDSRIAAAAMATSGGGGASSGMALG